MKKLPDRTLLASEISKASQRIRPYVQSTPLVFAHHLSFALDISINLKLENIQPTSSFKVRGAFNKLLSLDSHTLSKGVVAASTGNHGAAVAYACKRLATEALIFVPSNCSKTKLEAIKLFGGTIQIEGKECGESEQLAREYAAKNNMVYISPYNDLEVISGQGTIAVELLEQIPDVEVILAPVGGGGLIAGIASYIKLLRPSIEVIGCLPENSPTLYESVLRGKVVQLYTLPTLSDATAGNMDLDSLTFPLCQAYVDRYILASEEEILSAMKLIMEKEHIIIEGAVGTVLASLIKDKANLKNKKVAVIVSGSNVNARCLQQMLLDK